MIGLINWKRSSRRFVKQPCLLAGKGRPAQSSKLAEVYCLQRLKSVQWLSIHEGLSQGLQIDMRAEFWFHCGQKQRGTRLPCQLPGGHCWKRQQWVVPHSISHSFQKCEVPCFSLHRQCANNAFTCQRAVYISVLCIHSWYRVKSKINQFNERTDEQQVYGQIVAIHYLFTTINSISSKLKGRCEVFNDHVKFISLLSYEVQS